MPKVTLRFTESDGRITISRFLDASKEKMSPCIGPDVPPVEMIGQALLAKGELTKTKRERKWSLTCGLARIGNAFTKLRGCKKDVGQVIYVFQSAGEGITVTKLVNGQVVEFSNIIDELLCANIPPHVIGQAIVNSLQNASVEVSISPGGWMIANINTFPISGEPEAGTAPTADDPVEEAQPAQAAGAAPSPTVANEVDEFTVVGGAAESPAACADFQVDTVQGADGEWCKVTGVTDGSVSPQA